VAADCVRRKRSLFTKLLIRAGAGLYSRFFRARKVAISVPFTALAGSAPVDGDN
jgi:hypothetical protein